MQLTLHHVDIWSIDLAMSKSAEQTAYRILSADEQVRANRFKMPTHRRRFIAARYALRNILSLYVHDLPENIEFAYTNHQKPYLKQPLSINFNLAHSNEMALYACAYQQAIGIDIEKIKASYQPQIVKRYFSAKEEEQLLSLPSKQQVSAFYDLWSKKEAIIKAAGLGLALPLSSFSVSLNLDHEIIQAANQAWYLYSLPLDPGFKAAIASNNRIQTWSHWTLLEQKPAIIKKNNALY